MSRAPCRRRARLLLSALAPSRRGVASGAAKAPAPTTTKTTTTAAKTDAPQRTAAAASSSSAMLMGAQMREWDALPEWCALCAEPINHWNQHVGKREHISLAVVYDAVVHAERRWAAEDVWADAHAWLAHTRAARTRRDYRPPLADMGESPRHELLPFFAAHEYGGGAVDRRRELLLCLQALMRAGVVRVTRQSAHAQSVAGAKVLFKELYYPFARLFPRAEAKDLSCLSQVTMSTFNLIAVFDLCRFDLLPLPPDVLLTPAARAQQQHTRAASSHGGDDASGDDASGDGDDEDVDEASDGTFKWRGLLCRALFGALRWTFEPAAVPPPPHVRAAAAACATTADAHAAIAAHAARLMLSELVACKVAEYVVRLAPVVGDKHGLAEAALFRHAGNAVYRDPASTTFAAAMRAMERRRVLPRDAVVPPPPNWGVRNYLDDGVSHDGRFGDVAAPPPHSTAARVTSRLTTVTPR